MQRIHVRHSGYKPPNTLFTFPASDGVQRDHAHYDTIWVACSIIINNRQDHWLSTSLSGEPKLSADANGLMNAGNYYLHVPGSETDTSSPFPIVPNFRAWRYPHDQLPPLWAEASKNEQDRARDASFSIESIAFERCRITNRKLEVDNTHIIPVSEKPWFVKNEMGDYGDMFGRSGEIIADSSANLLRLRCDAHRLWDKLNFSIVPRNDQTPENRVAWFTQALANDEELHQYWHYQKLESLAGRPPQYLLARFAWDIFPRLHAFLQAGEARQLISTLDQAGPRQFSGLECRKFTVGQGRNRSARQEKRARSESNHDSNDPEDPQHEESSDGGSLASSNLPSSDDADSALAGIHRGRITDAKAQTTEEWYRYIYGHDIINERRGRKRRRSFDVNAGASHRQVLH